MEGMPWLAYCAMVFRTESGTCRVSETWSNIDMVMVSRKIEKAVCRMDAAYGYPSYPHRPATLGLKRAAVEAQVLAMVAPRPLPWERPIGPDLAVPMEYQPTAVLR